jgi:hypothetical protein
MGKGKGLLSSTITHPFLPPALAGGKEERRKLFEALFRVAFLCRGDMKSRAKASSGALVAFLPPS